MVPASLLQELTLGGSLASAAILANLGIGLASYRGCPRPGLPAFKISLVDGILAGHFVDFIGQGQDKGLQQRAGRADCNPKATGQTANPNNLGIWIQCFSLYTAVALKIQVSGETHLSPISYTNQRLPN